MKCILMDKGLTRKITWESQEGFSDLLGKIRVKRVLVQVSESFNFRCCAVGQAPFNVCFIVVLVCLQEGLYPLFLEHENDLCNIKLGDMGES